MRRESFDIYFWKCKLLWFRAHVCILKRGSLGQPFAERGLLFEGGGQIRVGRPRVKTLSERINNSYFGLFDVEGSHCQAGHDVAFDSSECFGTIDVPPCLPGST